MVMKIHDEPRFLSTLGDRKIKIMTKAELKAALRKQKKALMQEKAEKTVGTMLILSVIVSAVLLLSEVVFLEPLLKFFGSTQEVYPYAYDYTKIIIWGLPFMLFSTAINNTIRADGSPTYAMVSMLFGAVLNIVLDPLFLFVFDMGIEGAAIATVIGQAAGFIISAVYLPKFNHKTKKLDI